jgi:hypothetical protein
VRIVDAHDCRSAKVGYLHGPIATCRACRKVQAPPSPGIAAFIGCLLVTACRAGEAPDAASLLETHHFRGADGIMILDARIGDSDPMPFIIDSGASPCVLDPGVAEKLGIGARASTERMGGAGVFEGGVADRSVTLTIGAGELACSETLITDLFGHC